MIVFQMSDYVDNILSRVFPIKPLPINPILWRMTYNHFPTWRVYGQLSLPWFLINTLS